MSLQEALSATKGLREQREPPGLRAAVGRDRCGTCKWFRAKQLLSGDGACRLYAGYPVNAEQLSDAFSKR
jgi:hypothetical protein